ncbi:hypothetical protein VNO77_22644 [Canavalia gladiata]|uniref:Uncharacterized protein n=1 Tax=Canavalia gladiata TaxID=3824 RepID=A0AAN9QB67_CANGL
MTTTQFQPNPSPISKHAPKINTTKFNKSKHSASSKFVRSQNLSASQEKTKFIQNCYRLDDKMHQQHLKSPRSKFPKQIPTQLKKLAGQNADQISASDNNTVFS